MAGRLELRLLGNPSLRVDGQAREIQRKPLALLAYLVVTGQRTSRESLAALLWPRSKPAQAGANTRKAIWAIRHQLDSGLREIGPDGSLGIGAGLDSDVARFATHRANWLEHQHPPASACAECAEDLIQAAGLVRGELLAGFVLDDNADFDDWHRVQSERCRLETGDLLDRLCAYHRATGDLSAALAVALRRVDLDPLHEGATRQLMSLCYWAGDPGTALGHYERLFSGLREELDVSPEAETIALRDAILESRLLPPTDRLQPTPGSFSTLDGPQASGTPGGLSPGDSGASLVRSRRTASTNPTRQSAPSGLRGPNRLKPRSSVGTTLLERIEVEVEETAPEQKTALVQRGLPRPMARLMAAVLDPKMRVRLNEREAASIAAHEPLDLLSYRLGRIAAWSRPELRLDERFVALSLWLDRGEMAISGRWQVATDERDKSAGSRHLLFHDLLDLLETRDDPAMVLLGPPGAGKSTLLRRLEFDLAADGISRRHAPLSFLISLTGYQPGSGQAGLRPDEWLRAQWQRRFPRLPVLDQLMQQGPFFLLLDGLNEMPHANAAEYHDHVKSWREFLVEEIPRRPGLRVLFACRSLDYSAPLSSPDLRVPQIRVEALDDAAVRAFLEAYRPDRADSLWAELEETGRVDLFRVPYLLRMLVEEAEAGSSERKDEAALFTRIVRSALGRELEQGNPDLHPQPGGLIEAGDARRIVESEWPGPYALPDRGRLIRSLSRWAYALQSGQPTGHGALVRQGYERALETMEESEPERLIRAGLAMGLLEEDLGSDELGFRHQLLQEYFTARWLSRAPEPARVQVEWRSEAIVPRIERLLSELPPSAALPALPSTGWEESTRLAAMMVANPAPFLVGLMETNLVMAGRCARAIGDRCPDALRDRLRRALLERSRDPSADLRARVDAALVLGDLGDPRLERRSVPHSASHIPPSMVEIAGGIYMIGRDRPIEYSGREVTAHAPAHRVKIEAFHIARHAVTNAEWDCFMEAGGYEDERWWDTPAARRWQSGAGTNDGARINNRWWRQQFKARPEQIVDLASRGVLSEDAAERWRSWCAMEEADFERALADRWPGGVLREPAYWQDLRFNAVNQPVVGISWYEARAYCRWITAQSGTPFRLPSEVEWEAATRGRSARRYAYGDRFDALRCNTVETHLRRPVPIGVFPDASTPEGVEDLCGNSNTWTLSAWGTRADADFGYPYQADDGREDPAPELPWSRVVRGGSWLYDRHYASAFARDFELPDVRSGGLGLRLVYRPERRQGHAAG